MSRSARHRSSPRSRRSLAWRWLVYVRRARPTLPSGSRASARTASTSWSSNKYYVDEIYDRAHRAAAFEALPVLLRTSFDVEVDRRRSSTASARHGQRRPRPARRSRRGYVQNYALGIALGAVALAGLSSCVVALTWTPRPRPATSPSCLSSRRRVADPAVVAGAEPALLEAARPRDLCGRLLLSASIRCAEFDAARPGFQFVEQRAWMPVLRHLATTLGVDGICLLLVSSSRRS